MSIPDAVAREGAGIGNDAAVVGIDDTKRVVDVGFKRR